MDHLQDKVALLPLRRRLVAPTRLAELLILPAELDNAPLLLKVKHVAIDFLTDFAAVGTVPGRRTVGKLANLPDRYMLFPYLACWIHEPGNPCKNCLALEEPGSYAAHKLRPCQRRYVYGETLDGGFQDVIVVPKPSLLVRVPRVVSLHDSCFLFDVALPFCLYSVDVLVPAMKVNSGRVLVILEDSAREANDCLLVMRHLGLNHALFTLTDMASAKRTYAKKFSHVLVFARGPEAIELALRLGVSPGLELTKSRYTIGVFSGWECPEPADRTVYRHQPMYKDKFLYEQLLETLASFHYEPVPLLSSLGSVTSDELAATQHSHKLRSLWLHCDKDLTLGPGIDDSVHTTGDVLRMLQRRCDLRRVFFSHAAGAPLNIVVR